MKKNDTSSPSMSTDSSSTLGEKVFTVLVGAATVEGSACLVFFNVSTGVAVDLCGMDGAALVLCGKLVGT